MTAADYIALSAIVAASRARRHPAAKIIRALGRRLPITGPTIRAIDELASSTRETIAMLDRGDLNQAIAQERRERER
jgi:hypothetical protein